MAIFPGAVSTDSDLYIAVNNLSALLTDNPLTIGATTVNVNSTTLFPTVGFISIDAEIIKYTGKTATSFTGCTRGADGTSAASHLLGAQVDHNVVAAHHNTLKDETIAVQQFISDHIGLTTNVLAAEFEFLDGVTSNIQTQFGAKASTTLNNLGVTAINNALIPGLNNQVDLGTTSIAYRDLFLAGAIKSGVTTLATATELGYLTGVTSAIQTQLNSKATDSLVVHLAGTETITGQKTFSAQTIHSAGIQTGASIVSDADNVDDLGSTSANFRNLYMAGDVVIGSVIAIDFGADSSVDIRGTTTNDSATAGFVGEIVSSTISTATNFPATGVRGDLTSISLTAGHWLIYSHLFWSRNGATVSDYELSVSVNSGNTTAGTTFGITRLGQNATSLTYSDQDEITMVPISANLSATTTYYLKYESGFSAGTPQARGIIQAIRIR